MTKTCMIQVPCKNNRILHYQLAVKLFKANNRIIIGHRGGTYSLYSHLQKDGSKVKKGDEVRAGQQIGYSGNTGFSVEPHLHFEIYKPDKGINPILAVDGKDGTGGSERKSINPKFKKREVEHLRRLVKKLKNHQ